MENHLDAPELPRGVTSRHRGWQGENLEMEHQQEASRSEKHKARAAVDITQFQNHVVGEGFQAKHVIRQPSAQTGSTAIFDMTGGMQSGSRMEPKAPQKSTATKDDYMRNSAFRDFRREIEKILSS